MRKLTVEQVAKESPELFEKVKVAYKLVVPEIEDHVALTLEHAEPGSVAIHATFLKMIEEETKEIIYLELQMVFIKVPVFLAVLSRLAYVVFYDTLEQYEEARMKVANESTRKFGNENFPTYKNFGGKNIGSNGKA